MGLRPWIAACCLVFVGAFLIPATVGQDDRTSQEELAKVAERWQALGPERQAELRKRFSELQSLDPAERERMKRLGKRLRGIEKGLESNLSDAERRRLAELKPARRAAVLREMAAAEASSEAKALLRRLPSKVQADMDRLPAKERRALISKAKKSRLKRILSLVSEHPSRLGFSPEQARQLLEMAPDARRRALLDALKERSLKVLDSKDGKWGVGSRQRARLEKMGPESFARAFVRLSRDKPELLHRVLPGRRRPQNALARLHRAQELRPDEYLKFAEDAPAVRHRKVHHLQRVRIMRVLREEQLVSPEQIKELESSSDLVVLRFASKVSGRPPASKRKD